MVGIVRKRSFTIRHCFWYQHGLWRILTRKHVLGNSRHTATVNRSRDGHHVIIARIAFDGYFASIGIFLVSQQRTVIVEGSFTIIGNRLGYNHRRGILALEVIAFNLRHLRIANLGGYLHHVAITGIAGDGCGGLTCLLVFNLQIGEQVGIVANNQALRIDSARSEHGCRSILTRKHIVLYSCHGLATYRCGNLQNVATASITGNGHARDFFLLILHRLIGQHSGIIASCSLCQCYGRLAVSVIRYQNGCGLAVVASKGTCSNLGNILTAYRSRNRHHVVIANIASDGEVARRFSRLFISLFRIGKHVGIGGKITRGGYTSRNQHRARLIITSRQFRHIDRRYILISNLGRNHDFVGSAFNVGDGDVIAVLLISQLGGLVRISSIIGHGDAVRYQNGCGLTIVARKCTCCNVGHIVAANRCWNLHHVAITYISINRCSGVLAYRFLIIGEEVRLRCCGERACSCYALGNQHGAWSTFASEAFHIDSTHVLIANLCRDSYRVIATRIIGNCDVIPVFRIIIHVSISADGVFGSRGHTAWHKHGGRSMLLVVERIFANTGYTVLNNDSCVLIHVVFPRRRTFRREVCHGTVSVASLTDGDSI